MTTLSEVLNNLKKEGYTIDFNLSDNCLVCQQNSLQVHPDEFVVDKHYRFEGPTDPGDEAVVYAISSQKHNLKGTLVNGYGIYGEVIAEDMVKVLNENLHNPSNTTIVKSNESTQQRPDGDRLLEAPMVLMNLNQYRQQLKQEQAWINTDRNSITLFKNVSMRIVLIALHKGAEMKTHTAPGVISVQVLEGDIEFRIENRKEELGTGQMLSLHADIPHSVYAQEESVFLLTMAISTDGNKK